MFYVGKTYPGTLEIVREVVRLQRLDAEPRAVPRGGETVRLPRVRPQVPGPMECGSAPVCRQRL